MTQQLEATARTPLNRERVLQAAVSLADAAGFESLSMRRLAEELGVVPMAIYKHVANKDELLDGMVASLIGEIDPPAPDRHWKGAVRLRVLSARQALQRHPWARQAIESRTKKTPAVLDYMDSFTGMFLAGGFSNQLTHDATHLISSRVLGFTQDIFDPNEIRPEGARLWTEALGSGAYPRLAASLDGVAHDDEREFVFGLDLILDGLERARDARP